MGISPERAARAVARLRSYFDETWAQDQELGSRDCHPLAHSMFLSTAPAAHGLVDAGELLSLVADAAGSGDDVLRRIVQTGGFQGAIHEAIAARLLKEGGLTFRFLAPTPGGARTPDIEMSGTHRFFVEVTTVAPTEEDNLVRQVHDWVAALLAAPEYEWDLDLTGSHIRLLRAHKDGTRKELMRRVVEQVVEAVRPEVQRGAAEFEIELNDIGTVRARRAEIGTIYCPGDDVDSLVLKLWTTVVNKAQGQLSDLRPGVVLVGWLAKGLDLVEVGTRITAQMARAGYALPQLAGVVLVRRWNRGHRLTELVVPVSNEAAATPLSGLPWANVQEPIEYLRCGPVASGRWALRS